MRRAETRTGEEESVHGDEHAAVLRGIIETSPSGEILSFDEDAASLLGYASAQEAQEAVPSLLDVYADRWDVRRVRGRIREALRCDESRWKRADGSSVWIRTRVRVKVDASGQERFHVHLDDVTERRHLEDRLRQAQKMEAVGQLVGGVAHDFNNLLAAVMGQVALIRDALSEDPMDLEQAREDLDSIQSSAQRGARMVQHLLSFSRPSPIQPRKVATTDLVTDAVRLIRHLVPGTIRIEVPERRDTAVQADPAAVEQILLNLATNARDAMPDGGTLRLECGRVSWPQDRVARVGWGEPGTYGVIDVVDTGIGMPEETRLHAFEPFFSTKAEGRGTGLGLAMVYALMKQQKGYVELESSAGKGTRVRLYFPVAGGGALEEEEVLEDDRKESRGSGRILLVEDDEALRSVTARVLELHGYDVTEAGNGREAMDRLGAGMLPDLLITDLVMPEVGGMELIRGVAAAGLEIPVLLTSGYSVADGRISDRVAGGVGFLSKPWSLPELMEGVRACLAPQEGGPTALLAAR